MRKGGDDVIMATLNRVRLNACTFNPMKFNEDWMRDKRIIVFTSKCSDRQTDGHYNYNTPFAEVFRVFVQKKCFFLLFFQKKTLKNQK